MLEDNWKRTFVNSISNELASGELPPPIPLRAPLIDCISSSHFLISSRASSNVIDFVAVESDMMKVFFVVVYLAFLELLLNAFSMKKGLVGSTTLFLYTIDFNRSGSLLTRECDGVQVVTVM